VLDRAKACRFQLATCDPFLESDKLSGDIPNLDLDTALETADILSLHVPLTQENRHMINAKTLSTMKSSAILVNTARGGLIDTVALAAALNSGKIAGAGIDVFESEHLQANHPLLSCPNTLLNPHIAWYSELSSQELQRLAAEEAVRVVFGEAPQSRVA
jgi:D-3-phosphoglycerate dehydrogenase